MIGIIITTYNRPEYLKQCFDSLLSADIPNNATIYIIDDGSRFQTVSLIKHFRPQCKVVTVLKGKRLGIKDSLITGFERAFKDYELVMNLDGDAIVRNDFIKVLTDLKKKFPDKIITGFNSLTKNRNGSERHIVLIQGEGYNIKKSVGGINMILDRSVYEKHVLPALREPVGNWDHMSCISAGEAFCSVPSVVQHIGKNSSMGHTFSGEPIDIAEDFKPLALTNVTLIGVSTNEPDKLKKAAEISTKNISFGEVVLLTNQIKIKSKKEYSQFILKNILDYVSTDHFIVFQPDGYILNYKAWTNEFLNYDYIGAVWNWYKDNYRVGNGGFSLRSKKLHEILRDDKKITLDNDGLINNFEEDHNIGRIYRKYLELNYDIKFAPENIAKQFSIEGFGNPDRKYNGQFGFHGGSVDFNGAQLEHIPYLIKTHGFTPASLRHR